MIDKESRILITGACGSVGSALVDKFLNDGNIVCAFDHNENGLFKLENKYKQQYNHKLKLFLGDVRDESRLKKAFEGVDIVLHCAAIKHVYISEYNPFEAMQTNIVGTNNVIEAALNSSVTKVVYTSSDKAVNPTSTMGATKLLGERLISAANNHSGVSSTIFSSVRFGNVLNTNGSVLTIFKDQIKAGKQLTITSENMTRFFLSMEQAVELCMYACDNMLGGEVFIKNMGCCSIMSLARALTGKSDFSYKIIGHKPGEKNYEELVTDSEVERTVRSDYWYTILPDNMVMIAPKIAEAQQKRYSKFSRIDSPLNSKKELLSDSQVMSMLKNAKLI